MVFHPSHRPLEIATRFPQFHSPDDDDISPTNKKHKGTLLSSYRGGHFYWALTLRKLLLQCAQYVLGHHGAESRLRSWGWRLAARGGRRPSARRWWRWRASWRSCCTCCGSATWTLIRCTRRSARAGDRASRSSRPSQRRRRRHARRRRRTVEPQDEQDAFARLKKGSDSERTRWTERCGDCAPRPTLGGRNLASRVGKAELQPAPRRTDAEESADGSPVERVSKLKFPATPCRLTK